MGIKETLKAWLQPKDLSLILEIETPRVAYQQKLPGLSQGAFVDGPSAKSLAIHGQNQSFYFQRLGMLAQEYGDSNVIVINGNETEDGKTRFYVEPAIRGKTGNITRDELKALYPDASLHLFYILKERDKDRILALTS